MVGPQCIGIAFPPDGDRTSYHTLIKKEKQLVSQADIFPTMLQLMGMKPQYAIDGISLLDTTRSHKIVTCSETMPTFHNNPLSVVVDSSLQTLTIDFSRHSVTDSRTGKVYPYRKLPSNIRTVVDHRLQRFTVVK